MPTFESNVKGIVQVCLNCHSESKTGADRNGAPAQLDFDTFADVSARADDMLRRMGNTTSPMPPTASGLGPVSQQDQATFQAWIDAGKPEN